MPEAFPKKKSPNHKPLEFLKIHKTSTNPYNPINLKVLQIWAILKTEDFQYNIFQVKMIKSKFQRNHENQ